MEQERDMEVIAEAADGREAVQLTRELKPDVIVMDLSMPDLNGIEATRQVLEENPGVKVLALSMHSDKRFVAGVLGAGASGYLLKDCALDELVRAIHSVAVDQTYLSPSIAGVVVQGYTQQVRGSDAPVMSSLSPREQEVLQLMAEGKPVKEIASILHLSVKTVETHRHQIMNKLGVYSVAELTKYAIREGLTSLGE